MNKIMLGAGLALAALIYFGPDTTPDWIPIVGQMDDAHRALTAILIVGVTVWIASRT